MALEGAPFWLCRLLEGAFQATAPLIFSGEAFDEGYYLVKIQWLEFVNIDSADQQRYRLGEERMLSVRSLLRFRAINLLLESSGNAIRDGVTPGCQLSYFLCRPPNAILPWSANYLRRLF